jgi:hypothetical protein
LITSPHLALGVPLQSGGGTVSGNVGLKDGQQVALSVPPDARLPIDLHSTVRAVGDATRPTQAQIQDRLATRGESRDQNPSLGWTFSGTKFSAYARKSISASSNESLVPRLGNKP